MMNTKKEILKELDIQDEINGVTPETKQLRHFLECIQWASQWDSMVKIRWVSTGPLSYQARREYFMTETLKKIYNSFSA